MVERVLCMNEVRRSMPGSSSFFFFLRLYKWDQEVVHKLSYLDRGISSYGRERALHARSTGINAWILQFLLFSQDCIGGVKKLFRSHHNWIGGLAHMVERVLRMHEAPGSMPGSSSFFFFFKIVLVGSRNR